MQGKSVSPLALRGNPQLSRWYQQFHSAVRGVSIALMKSQSPCARDADLLGADAGHLRDRDVGEPVGGAAVALLELGGGQGAVAVGVGPVELLGQDAGGGLTGVEHLVLIPVQRGDQPTGRRTRVHLQTGGRVRVADDRALRLRPAQDRRGPGGPALRRAVRARVGLVPEVQETDVPQRLRAEAADLDVVFQDGERGAQSVGPGLEEPALVVVARAPGQDAAHVQPLAADLFEHVRRFDPLGGAGVVGAAGGVDVVVAADEAKGPRVDPALERNGQAGLAVVGDRDPLPDRLVLRPPAREHRQVAGGEQDDPAVAPVDLLLEEEIGGEPLGLGRVDVVRPVEEGEPGRRRGPVGVSDGQPDGDGRPDFEEDRGLAPEAEVLRPLADVEPDRRLAAARLTAVEQRQGVLDLQAAQPGRKRRIGEHLRLEEPLLRPAAVLVVDEGELVLPGHAQLGDPRVDRPGLRAADPEGLRDRAFVEHLDDDRRVPCLLEHRRRRPPGDLDARLGVDRDDEQDVRVDEALDRPSVRGLFEPVGDLGRQRPAQEPQRLGQPPRVRRQRLRFDVGDLRDVGPGGTGDDERQEDEPDGPEAFEM
jgi:hypothetical protein